MQYCLQRTQHSIHLGNQATLRESHIEFVMSQVTQAHYPTKLSYYYS